VLVQSRGARWRRKYAFVYCKTLHVDRLRVLLMEYEGLVSRVVIRGLLFRSEVA